LVFALGGTAVAARHYLITSTKQIKPSVLRQLHGKIGATGKPGANGAPGPQGPQGPQGAQGAPGPSNLSALTVIAGPRVSVPAGEVGAAAAICPGGTRVVSGGGFGSIAGLDVSETSLGREGWFIVIDNDSSIALEINAQALCAGAGQAVAAAAPSARRRRVEAQMHQAEATLKAQRALGGS